MLELYKPLYFISDKNVLHLQKGVSQDLIYALESYYGQEFDEIVIYDDMDVCPKYGFKLNRNEHTQHEWNKNIPAVTMIVNFFINS